MSVYIRGMEMPRNCCECPINLYLCNYGYKHLLKHEKLYDERADDCPLILVPNHGRLIDADAFIARFAKAEEMLSVLPVPEEFKQIYSELAGEMKEEIQECQTIISADKEAE